MNKITQQYQTEIEKYDSFCSKVELLIKELLTSNNVKYHKIEARSKSVESLDKKILSKNNKYDNIDDITDIIGIRIITYFEDEVDIVANVIEKEFKIDKENSADKRILDSNTFGYRSLHYVVQLNTDRNKLIEYKRFSNIKFEIQIRSILQHAWAEIEHDLGYKGLGTVPDSFKRNFSMIAALLEMADRDFVTLREESLTYKVQNDNYIKKNNISSDINIDIISLKSFINNNKTNKEIIIEISEKVNISNIQELDNTNTLTTWISALFLLKIYNIKHLSEKIIENKKLIIAIGSEIIEQGTTTIYTGWTIPYLCYIEVLKQDELKQKEFCTKIFNMTESVWNEIKDTVDKNITLEQQ